MSLKKTRLSLEDLEGRITPASMNPLDAAGKALMNQALVQATISNPAMIRLPGFQSNARTILSGIAESGQEAAASLAKYRAELTAQFSGNPLLAGAMGPYLLQIASLEAVASGGASMAAALANSVGGLLTTLSPPAGLPAAPPTPPNPNPPDNPPPPEDDSTPPDDPVPPPEDETPPPEDTNQPEEDTPPPEDPLPSDDLEPTIPDVPLPPGDESPDNEDPTPPEEPVSPDDPTEPEEEVPSDELPPEEPPPPPSDESVPPDEEPGTPEDPPANDDLIPDDSTPPDESLPPEDPEPEDQLPPPDDAPGDGGSPPDDKIPDGDIKETEIRDAEGMVSTLPNLDSPLWVSQPNGLKIWDVELGSGLPVQAGDPITVYYTGWLLNGTIFDSRRVPNRPVTFPLNGLIQGWQLGIPGMAPGGIRRLYIPAALAYGSQGTGSIPPNSDLVFEIKLV